MDGRARWRLNGDPKRNSLRLLPLGPDRVGEGVAHRQSPPPISRALPRDARQARRVGNPRRAWGVCIERRLTMEANMGLIVLKVVNQRRRWAVMHNEVILASFDTKEEAECSALAIARHRPQRDVAQLDLVLKDGGRSEIRIY